MHELLYNIVKETTSYAQREIEDVITKKIQKSYSLDLKLSVV